MFSSIIMTTFLLYIMVKTKYWNQFTTDIPSPVSMLIYNNFASSMSLVCNSSHNVTSPMDLSNNFLSLNDHGIPFLWTSSKNFYHPPGLTLSWSQLTSLPSKQSLFLPITPLYPQTQHICSFFMYFPNTVFFPMLPLTEAQSLCQTSSISQVLLLTCGFTSLQTTTLKAIDKPNAQIRLLSNISIYIITTSKITSLNSYFLQNLPIIML